MPGRSQFFLFQRKSYILSISFLLYFGIIYIWPMYHSLDKRIWFTIIFLHLTLFQIRIFFIIPSLILSHLELLRIDLPQLTPGILIENCDYSIFPGLSILFSYAPACKTWLLKSLSFFIYLGFFSWTFTNHRTIEKGGGNFINSSLALQPNSQTLVD